jgi:hypothetical protein
MEDKSSSIGFVLPELGEQKDFFSPLNYWAITVSDSKFVIYFCDWVSGSGGVVSTILEMGSKINRMSKVKSLIGTDIEELIANVKIKYVYNRENGKHIKFKLSKKLLVWQLHLEEETKPMGYDPKIMLNKGNIEKLKQAVPELEFEYLK